MRVLPLAEFVAAFGCGLCVDFEGRMLYLSDHQESTGSKDIYWQKAVKFRSRYKVLADD